MWTRPRTGPGAAADGDSWASPLLQPLAQIAERASQGALQLLQLADLAPGGLPALRRRLTESAQLGRAVVEQTPRSDTRQIGQRGGDRRPEQAGRAPPDRRAPPGSAPG